MFMVESLGTGKILLVRTQPGILPVATEDQLCFDIYFLHFL